MDRERRSRTSDWVAALRALYSEAPSDLDVVGDTVAIELLSPGFRKVVEAARTVPFGTRLAHRVLTRSTLGLAAGVPLRTAAIDGVLREHAGAGGTQLLILGAGLDARAWRLPELHHTSVYEVDHPNTQAYKRERIAHLTPLAARVEHVPVDFEQQSLEAELDGAGFDRARPSAVVWEGVTMYLTPGAIEQTLGALGRLCAPGSVLLLTYVRPDYASGWRRSFSELTGRLISEPLLGAVSAETLHGLLENAGFGVAWDEGAEDWAPRYWPRSARRGVRTYERLVCARRG